MTSPREILEFARNLAASSPHWKEFQDAIYGEMGIASRAFPTEEEMQQLRDTPEHQEIMRLAAGLRRIKGEPEKVKHRRLSQRRNEFASIGVVLPVEADNHLRKARREDADAHRQKQLGLLKLRQTELVTVVGQDPGIYALATLGQQVSQAVEALQRKETEKAIATLRELQDMIDANRQRSVAWDELDRIQRKITELEGS